MPCEKKPNKASRVGCAVCAVGGGRHNDIYILKPPAALRAARQRCGRRTTRLYSSVGRTRTKLHPKRERNTGAHRRELGPGPRAIVSESPHRHMQAHPPRAGSAATDSPSANRSGRCCCAGSRPCQRRIDCLYRCGACGDAIKIELLERRQRAAVERGDKGGAPGVCDLGAA